MRSVTFILASFTLLSCGGDLGEVGADALWQVRCPAGFPGCASAGDAVNLLAFDGAVDPETMRTARISCSVSEDDVGTRTIDLDIGYGRDPALSIRGLNISGGSVIALGCRISVVDDSNTLAGACGPATPSDAQPCQITNPTFTDRMEGPAFSFSLLCRNLPAPAAPTMIQRDFTKPNVSREAAPISVFNCDGF